MWYLSEESVVLDGKNFEKHIALVPKTLYKEGLKNTIKAYQIQV